jgi:FKBP-type peptidyl-prolyl cis-trans isomerase (trigger factor)
LPELNNEFAKDVSDATTLDELKIKIRESLDHEREHRHKDLLRGKVIEALVKLHDFLYRNLWWSIKWISG